MPFHGQSQMPMTRSFYGCIVANFCLTASVVLKWDLFARQGTKLSLWATCKSMPSKYNIFKWCRLFHISWLWLVCLYTKILHLHTFAITTLQCYVSIIPHCKSKKYDAMNSWIYFNISDNINWFFKSKLFCSKLL